MGTKLSLGLSFIMSSPDHVLCAKLSQIERRIKQLKSLLIIPYNPLSRVGGQTIQDPRISKEIESLQALWSTTLISAIRAEKLRALTRCPMSSPRMPIGDLPRVAT